MARGTRDVAVRDGRIAGLGHYSSEQAGQVIDCTGLHILPGVIDTQVHLREPAANTKKTLKPVVALPSWVASRCV